jgi:3-hydroxyisobutyrate dehydrogenase-like beta-hydroxyacid dehydrogenase
MKHESMNVGFVGLGMLGLPRALAVATRGHSVRGFDADPARMSLDWYPGVEHPSLRPRRRRCT